MMTVKRDDRTKPVQIKISGVIDERAEFGLRLGKIDGEVIIDCGSVLRINSAGIKLWREFWQKERRKGFRGKFKAVSTVLVDAMNVVSDFILQSEVESICVPYLCTACNKENISIISVGELRQTLPILPVLKCPICDAQCELNEIASDYFRFLTD